MNSDSVREFFKSKAALISDADMKYVDSLLDTIKQKEERPAEPTQQSNKELAEKLKIEGNEAFKSGDFKKAVEIYTKAINLDPKNPLLYSNRAIAYSKLEMDAEGINDCLAGIKLDPSFVKFYIRIGTFYMKTDKKKALHYFNEGLKYEPSNKMLRDLADSCENEESVGPAFDDNSKDMFNGLDPSKMQDMMKDENVQKMVKDFIKDKSPEELAEMMKNAFKSMKK